MIAMLSGVVTEKRIDTVILDVSGIGYGIFVTSEDINKLVSDQTATLYIYEHIREQVHDLFGFINRDTQKLFEQLLAVNGVGPRMAVNVLSIGSIQAVRTAIAGGDVGFIQAAPGVGKRVAERIVVELKDKVGLVSVDLESTGLLTASELLLKDEAIEALVVLGYTSQDAALALKKVNPDLTLEERVKSALQRSN